MVEIHPQVFSVIREAPGGGDMILCLTNVSGKPVSLDIDLVRYGLEDTQWYDLVDGRGWMAHNDALHLEMTPYDVVWLMPYVQIERAIETGAGAH